MSAAVDVTPVVCGAKMARPRTYLDYAAHVAVVDVPPARSRATRLGPRHIPQRKHLYVANEFGDHISRVGKLGF
jgi:hypothetical protein